MPVYSGQSEENDHEKYPDDEVPEHVHYGADDDVCIVTLHEDGPEADHSYDGDPYECELCDKEVDYEEDQGGEGEAQQAEDESEGDQGDEEEPGNTQEESEDQDEQDQDDEDEGVE